MPRPRKQRGPWLEQCAGSPNWYIRWYDGGARKRKSCGTADYSIAEEKLAEFILERSKPCNADAAAVTVAQCLLDYCKYHVPTIADASKGRALDDAEKLNDEFGSLTVDACKVPVIEAHIERRRKEGVTDATIARRLRTLKAALNRAYKKGMLASTPPFIPTPAESEPADSWHTPEEYQRLLEACHQPHLRLYVQLLALTGARPGAILALTWDRVDFRNRRITLLPTGKKQNKKRQPVIAMGQVLHDLLLATWEGRAGECAHVIQYKGKPVKSCKTAYRKARARAGLGKEVRPYTLRHSNATWQAQAGVDLWKIAGSLGHKDIKTTQRYAKHHPSFQQESTDAIDAIMVKFRSSEALDTLTNPLQPLDFHGGQYRDRTCGPRRVKAVNDNKTPAKPRNS